MLSELKPKRPKECDETVPALSFYCPQLSLSRVEPHGVGLTSPALREREREREMERERERDRKKVKESEKERERECVSVCERERD